MGFLRVAAACLMVLLAVVGCEQGDEGEFLDFVQNVLTRDANDDPVAINNQNFPNQLAAGEPLPLDVLLP
jgi:Tfp pilus assembly protein PilP